jgi:hypothetical protein
MPQTIEPAAKRVAPARLLLVLTALLLGVCHDAAHARQPPAACAEFQRLVKKTYGFKPSRLSSEAELKAKSAAMDRFWKEAERRRAEFLPCLRAALADPQSDPWFRYDGGNLLVVLDPSRESKAEQVRQYAAVDLDDVDLSWWVAKIAQRGAEGFDVSEAGARWLARPGAKYYLPQHGAWEVGPLLGALFIFGSMDEAQATPALVRIVNQPNHPGRVHALALLMNQATPESLRALRQIADAGAGFPPGFIASLRAGLERPNVLTPRDRPKTTREQFLKAFDGILNNDRDYFSELVRQVPDGELDAVAVLKPEDVPLVRMVRRKFISTASPHAAEYYNSFTKILMTLVWRPELTK